MQSGTAWKHGTYVEAGGVDLGIIIILLLLIIIIIIIVSIVIMVLMVLMWKQVE